MKEFSSKLNGFKKFKTEMSDGITTDNAGETPIGQLSSSFNKGSQFKEHLQANFGKGTGKGMNAGGPKFAPNATNAQTPAMGHSPTGGTPTGYRTNDGPMKNVSDNVTNNVSRGIQGNTGAGINNQRSFAKQPGYGQKDLSHVDSMQRQKAINSMPITPKKKTFGGRFFGQEGGSKKQIGRKIETSELFGKTGDAN